MDEGLYQRLKKYNPKEKYAFILDYIPIQIQLDLDIKAQLNIKRYVIGKFKANSFLSSVK
jgi:hypothetical protein